MQRSFSSWGVTALGLALAAGGVYAMATGWDMIVLERGWSLFIAGSVALSGGVVTAALGRVIAALARLAPAMTAAAAPAESEAATPAPAKPEFNPAPEKVTDDLFPALAEAPVQDLEKADPLPAADALSEEQPREVDRYTAGGATYIMMSNGSVEVRSATGTELYPSLAALRANAEARRR